MSHTAVLALASRWQNCIMAERESTLGNPESKIGLQRVNTFLLHDVYLHCWWDLANFAIHFICSRHTFHPLDAAVSSYCSI
ncbi:hypothetical protein GDO78_018391 [Eleutherodactylus coqui]|uniref:Uncharacterized protein n=1 Tax=Eleutherodactylus coqui TaxID=57060 RepID=A0A8J6BEK6_ELECQ|nr:hypothetical protein GDO78_018391 [Eleutherodactylus coqui]